MKMMEAISVTCGSRKAQDLLLKIRVNVWCALDLTFSKINGLLYIERINDYLDRNWLVNNVYFEEHENNKARALIILCSINDTILSSNLDI